MIKEYSICLKPLGVSSQQGAQVPATSTETPTTSANRLPATGNVREGDLTLLGVLALLGGSVLGIKAFWKRN
ncbi:MAG TPA: LPXTG cell wall anchor domain-containing protein [Candidatus Ligilactobacillus avistercoris]|nr:LPXTG cell wall anchor domain-containing protein [Candidatus Ligilactobacillus avistercoris]